MPWHWHATCDTRRTMKEPTSRRGNATRHPSLCAFALSAAFCTACVDEPTETCEVARLVAPLVGGHERTEYLGLSDDQRDAVVGLELDWQSLGLRDLCSGVAIHHDRLLTAAHCFSPLPPVIRVHGRSWSHTLLSSEVVIDTHPTQDVAVLRVPGLAAPHWLAVNVESTAALVGQLVEVAGAGMRNDGSAGEVEFAVARVVAVDERSLTSELTESGGPCRGDSGGPLLIRGPSGLVKVAGVLAAGDPDCRGRDRYERLDSISVWLDPPEIEAPYAVECTNLPKRGRCFGQRAVWCDANGLTAADCAAEEACGWSVAASAFRCVAPAADPCRGISELGECSDDVALRCEAGKLVSMSCRDCGAPCAISSRSGKAVCSVP
jgi:hypothetical protein